MNLKKLIKSRTFIVLSASTILLSTIICYLIFNPKTPINYPTS
ncbi:MAG: hypothetical protein U9532_00780 ['Conium maculatum' witches'-broom phytoplasma]|nr:hypothetical protein ['Conium maculatum' witches'-broom phytoplasma]